MRSGHSLAILMAAAAMASAAPAQAQDPAAYFKQNCMSCHTVGGGRLIGPDLKDVTSRKEKDWLVQFIRNPQAMIASGDAYARKLLDEAGGVPMPPIPGMTDALARSLLDLIEAESKLETSRFKGIQVDTRPFLPADVERGRELFTGRTALKNGGPACLSCHTMPHTATLGGGVLGPDLTKVYERLGGRQGMTAWLSAPATPTMQAVFANKALDPQEITSLVACFEDGARNSSAVSPQQGRFGFMTVGSAAAISGLLLCNRIWRGRLRGVRSELLQADHTQGDR